MKVIILHNQNLLDLAIQHTGSVENAFAIAVANGLSLTDDLEAGRESGIPKVEQNKDILSYYQAKKLQPATGISLAGNQLNQSEGIDYWAIQMDFVVS